MHLLHLEDNTHDLTLVRELLLTEWPDCVITAVDSRPAFIAQLVPGRHDAILSDFKMPGFSGLEALELARNRVPDTPFIFVSGTIGEDRAIEAVQAGAADYVLKDRMKRLTTALRRALRDSEERRNRRRAEAALAESIERFQLIARATRDALWDWNLLTNEIWWSEGHATLFGYPADAAAGSHNSWLLRIHPGDVGRVQGGLQQVIHGTANTWVDEYGYRRADGSYADVLDRGYVLRDASGRAIRMLGSMEDVTDRRHALASVTRERDFSHAVLNSLPGIFYLFDERGRFLRWNRRFAEVSGYTDAEIAGMDPLDFFAGKDREAVRGRIAQVFATGHAEAEADFLTRQQAGIPYHFTGRLIVLDGQRCLIGMGVDISEMKQLQEQFLRAQRLEGIGMLAAGIAHDLNNVLTPILMAGPMLRVRATDPQDQRLLGTLEHSAERGAALVRQILAFAHGTAGEAKLMQVKHLARDIIEIIEGTFPKSITLDHHFPADTWPIRANPTQIHQVLLNLCVNARDAMPRGGTLRLRAANQRLDAEAARAIPDARPGSFVVLEVEDTGTGIPPEVLDHIWEPFFTTKQAGKGTGLGLSTVRGIAESHQGFVELRSAPDRGTTFRVFLPAAEEGATGGPETAAPFLPRGEGELLLLVDDEATNRDVAHATLARFGYRVLAAANGTEAVALFIPRAEEVRLVITDLNMPNLDGAGLARILLRLKPGLRILAVSGLTGQPETGPDAPESFADGYLSKPFKPEPLLLKVHQLLQLPPRA
ncbi:MAG: response regulator [Opitutaceae bacterium]|nr:response regulator [Opitutaceae bacterium]